MRQTYKQLSDAIQSYEKKASTEQSLKVKALTVKMGIARELGLDAKQMNKPYSADEIARVENYAEELANEKITGKLYTLGVPYDNDDVRTSVYAMATDPIAYGMLPGRGADRKSEPRHRCEDGPTACWHSPQRLP